MNDSTQKGPAPAYGSLRTMHGVMNNLREAGAGHIPPRIDKTVMSNLSGSVANETISTLKYLGLIKENGATTPAFTAYVMATDEERKPLLKGLITSAYGFLFNSDFDVERATSGMVAEAFRLQGPTGSTLTRAVSFFLSAAKEAGIKVSPSLKAPNSKGSSTPRTAKEKPSVQTLVTPAVKLDPEMNNVHRFELPIPGKPSVVVYVPKELDGKDWEMFSQMFALYVSHWKGFTSNGPSKAKEPGSQ